MFNKFIIPTMKIALFFSLLVFQTVSSQEFSKIDKLILEYNYSFSHGIKQNIQSKKEIIEFEKQGDNKYRLNFFKRETEYYDSERIKKKNVTFKKKDAEISAQLISFLQFQLNPKNNNFNFNDITSKLSAPKKIKIKKILKFKNYILESNKENKKIKLTKKIVKSIKKFKDFNEFINSIKPTSETLYGSFDAHLSLSIKLISKNDTLVYEGIPHLMCGQPINLRNDFNRNNRILNLKINEIILSILPKKSWFRNEFDVNNMVDLYIAWYLDRQIES